MKNLGKLNINPEKLMKSVDLLNLKGGAEGGPCGPGFDTLVCDFVPWENGPRRQGIVCVTTGGDGCDALENTYPELGDCICSVVGQGEPG